MQFTQIYIYIYIYIYCDRSYLVLGQRCNGTIFLVLLADSSTKYIYIYIYIYTVHKTMGIGMHLFVEKLFVNNFLKYNRILKKN